MQLYVPSALFVLAAYITLFMPPSGLVARSGVPVSLCPPLCLFHARSKVMVLFALFSMNNGTRANVPLVSYATMADIWFEVNSIIA